MKKTLILGASPQPERYAYKAAHNLVAHRHPIVNVGIKKGEVAGIPIEPANEIYQDIDTITLYLGAENQKQYYDYILKTQPKRIIFNPGTENEELVQLAMAKGIKTELACTLVLLSIGAY